MIFENTLFKIFSLIFFQDKFFRPTLFTDTVDKRVDSIGTTQRSVMLQPKKSSPSSKIKPLPTIEIETDDADSDNDLMIPIFISPQNNIDRSDNFKGTYIFTNLTIRDL